MNTYKIKRILNSSIIISYRTENGTLKELEISIDPTWDKERIEKEIYIKKQVEENKDINLHLDQYFSVGDELEFNEYDPEKEYQEEVARQEQEIQKLIDKENEEFLNMIVEYRNTPADYKVLRWYEYPKFEDQFDALYWMRQGVMEPIEELDKKIKAIKEKYPKDQPTNLTNADLDTMFPDLRPSDYLNELRSRNIQADFLE